MCSKVLRNARFLYYSCTTGPTTEYLDCNVPVFKEMLVGMEFKMGHEDDEEIVLYSMGDTGRIY